MAGIRLERPASCLPLEEKRPECSAGCLPLNEKKDLVVFLLIGGGGGTTGWILEPRLV